MSYFNRQTSGVDITVIGSLLQSLETITEKALASMHEE